jgi:UDP-N-acetylmuramate: L-alanyl-gamma-D-glutamyl-meso-diaminopimelate ligase
VLSAPWETFRPAGVHTAGHFCILAAMHYHLIGIAGTAMGSLAGLLREAGHRVTGSDEGVYPPMSTLLTDLGIEFAHQFDPANLDPVPDMVVVGNAISRGNAELEAVLERRIPYTSAALTIKEEFLRQRRVLAVAGTHGKTTTTSILAWLLECAGLRPSFLVGGVVENFGASFRLVDPADSDLFVIEADEYDTAYFDKGPKMWHYLPLTAVVTNVEFDHADIFRDDVAYRFAFERFINLVPRNGTLVAGWESEVVRAMAARSWAPVESFGLAGPGREDAGSGGAAGRTVAAGRTPDPRDDPPHPRYHVDGIQAGPDGTLFNLHHDGQCLGDFETPLVGNFNVQNCLAAIAAARSVGAGWDGVREGMRTFRSVRRRMEVYGEVDGVTLVDDFAHHPTAVAGTIQAARQRFGAGRRIVALFEPRSYTAQRREFQDAYREALRGAQRVIIAGMFHPERYDETTGMDPHELAAQLRDLAVDARHIPDVDDIVHTLTPELEPGDVVLIMSNGGFGGIHRKLLEALRGA